MSNNSQEIETCTSTFPFVHSAYSRITIMEDGGIDRTVINCQQNQLGQMPDFSPLLTFLIFDL